MTNNYTSTFTGENFLYYETKTVAKLIINGISEKEIKEKILEDNLFQYNTIKRTGRRIADILKRLKKFDSDFLDVFVSSSNEEGRLINLYILYKNNKLLSDFINEVIRNNFEIQQYTLKEADIKGFFNQKAQTDENVRNWKDYTIYKLSQVLRKILIEAGILKKDKEYLLSIPYISEDLKNYLIKRDALSFLESIGVKLY